MRTKRPARFERFPDGRLWRISMAARIVALSRARWPDTRIALRADSGLAREASAAQRQANGVDYPFDPARNDRPVAQIADALAAAEADSRESGGERRP